MIDIVIKPLFTEKATKLAARASKKNAYTYVFKVHRDATKDQIKAAIEKMYDVRVEEVRTALLPAKIRTRYTRKGISEARIPSYKKAYVRLAPGQTLNLYENL
jgi:large subunit ribosomal protein L23